MQPLAANDEMHRNEMLIQLAVVWYEKGNLDLSKQLYLDIEDNLKRRDLSAARASILAIADCNLGFIYVDEGLPAEALRVFERGLKVQHSTDCEAGLAIALKQNQQDDLALAAYRRVRSEDRTYTPDGADVLRTSNFWSQTAVDLLTTLAAEDQRTALTQFP